MSNNVNDLFGGAVDDGIINPDTAAVLAAPDLGAQIQAGLGVDVDGVEASEVFLISQLIDDSGSIRFIKGNTEAVREGHNLVLESLLASKQKNSMFAHTLYLSGKVLNPYVQLVNAVRMDASNYDPRFGTPLYDQTVTILGTVLKKYKDFADVGCVCRTATLLVTDGRDEGSTRNSLKDAAKVIRDMLMLETHIVAAMGISDGTTDFRAIFEEMGIPSEWVLTPGNSQSEIRKAFGTFSQSAVRASQSAKSFSRAALGGFNAP